jgi:hypothetical protein
VTPVMPSRVSRSQQPLWLAWSAGREAAVMARH